MTCLADVTAAGRPRAGPAARAAAAGARRRPGARASINKMPENYFYLGLIALMFPRAVVIHCRRDLRDVALSCWIDQLHRGPLGQPFRPHRRAIRRVPPADGPLAARPCRRFAIHEVDYEEAVADLEGVARRLLAAMGLDWDPACLEFHRTRRPVRTASQIQVRKPIYRTFGRAMEALPGGAGRAVRAGRGSGGSPATKVCRYPA